MTFDPNIKLTRENFKSLPIMSTDGAWGTEMQKLGLQPGQMGDLWNVDNPDNVYTVAKNYVDAGSNIILTNTFNCNRVVLKKHGLEARVAELSKAGAALSKKAAAGKAFVFASMGPTGEMVMMGALSPEEVEDVYAEQAAALEAGGADALVVETQTDAIEAAAGIRGAMKATKLPVGASFTFDSGKDGLFTMMGVSIAQAYQMALDNGASFVGANCGRGIETFIAVAQEFAKCGSELPIWIKGNAGKPEVNSEGKLVYMAQPELYATAVPQILDAGARFVGGCCGSNPGHIKAVAEAIANYGGCGKAGCCCD